MWWQRWNGLSYNNQMKQADTLDMYAWLGRKSDPLGIVQEIKFNFTDICTNQNLL